jgi:hypothetical protein
VSATDTVRDATALDSPYVGLNFYTQDNAAIFFGRDTERTVLISNLRASRLTLLYAQSGTGKSSVLRAGVASRLGELARRSLEQRGTARHIPVVFSSWQHEPTDELIAEIQKTIIPFVPETSPPELASGLLEEAIEAASMAADATLLIMLDQFEEYFLYRSKEVRRERFADEFASCINRASLRANFLISIREDAFSGLGDLFQGRIDNVYGNYLHLEHLTRESARQAIEKPIASFNELHKHDAPFEIEPDLIDAVLGQLRPDQFAPGQGAIGGLDGANGAGRYADEIAAPYLQLVMKRLWDTELAKGSRKLRLETFEELGEARTIIGTHVDRALGGLSDDDREAVGDVFRHLVAPSGSKIALTASDLAEYIGRSTEETAALLERLASSDTRILRRIAPPPGRDGETRFEISHDILAPAILDWRRRRRALQLEQEKEAAELQARNEKSRARRFRKIAIGAAVLMVIAIAGALSALLSPSPAPRPSTIWLDQLKPTSGKILTGKIIANSQQFQLPSHELLIAPAQYGSNTVSYTLGGKYKTFTLIVQATLIGAESGFGTTSLTVDVDGNTVPLDGQTAVQFAISGKPFSEFAINVSGAEYIQLTISSIISNTYDVEGIPLLVAGWLTT